jgi:hypothetical protein
LPPPLQHLGLSRDQDQEALRIIEKHRPELEEILVKVAPSLRTVQRQVEQELRDILTDKQRIELERAQRNAPPPPLPGIRP